jgi:hypothetical protein
MTAPRRRREVFANPFFAILLVTSVVFVITVLGYLASPWVLSPDQADRPVSPASIALARWLDRRAPAALLIEILIMFVTGVLAMATDSWFSERSKRKSTS